MKIKKLYLILIFLCTHFISAPLYAKTPMIWQMEKSKWWEFDWLMELLESVDVEIIEDPKREKFIDNSIVVVSWQGNEAYFKKLHDMGYKFGVIQLSDELYKVTTDYYTYAQFVFRNHWHPKFEDQKQVFAFALGYKAGFWKNCNKEFLDSFSRPYLWSFAGQLTRKPTREKMIAAMKTIPDYFIHETATWEDPNGLSTEKYRDILLKTVFVPCARGWVNLDSFRLYEALECGCIPIVEKGPPDYFAYAFGDHPFLTISSWDEAPALIKKFIDDRNLCEKKRKECYAWWCNYKKMLQHKMVSTIKNAFVDAV